MYGCSATPLNFDLIPGCRLVHLFEEVAGEVVAAGGCDLLPPLLLGSDLPWAWRRGRRGSPGRRGRRRLIAPKESFTSFPYSAGFGLATKYLKFGSFQICQARIGRTGTAGWVAQKVAVRAVARRPPAAGRLDQAVAAAPVAGRWAAALAPPVPGTRRRGDRPGRGAGDERQHLDADLRRVFDRASMPVQSIDRALGRLQRAPIDRDADAVDAAALQALELFGGRRRLRHDAPEAGRQRRGRRGEGAQRPATAATSRPRRRASSYRICIVAFDQRSARLRRDLATGAADAGAAGGSPRRRSRSPRGRRPRSGSGPAARKSEPLAAWTSLLETGLLSAHRATGLLRGWAVASTTLAAATATCPCLSGYCPQTMSLPAKIQDPVLPEAFEFDRLRSTTSWRLRLRSRRRGGCSCLHRRCLVTFPRSGFRFRTREFPSRRERARESKPMPAEQALTEARRRVGPSYGGGGGVRCIPRKVRGISGVDRSARPDRWPGAGRRRL